jgi:hypothetical protein
MTRFTAASFAAIIAAGALAWVGTSLLALPHHEDAVARTVAGGTDARQFGTALGLFRGTVDETTRSTAGLALRARAERALASQHGSPHLRSQAQTLLGVLALEDAVAQRRQQAAKVAIAAFTNAVRLDPKNEQAAIDLELLLAKQRSETKPGDASRGKRRQRSSSHQGAGHGATAASGKGGGY